MHNTTPAQLFSQIASFSRLKKRDLELMERKEQIALANRVYDAVSSVADVAELGSPAEAKRLIWEMSITKRAAFIVQLIARANEGLQAEQKRELVGVSSETRPVASGSQPASGGSSVTELTFRSY